MSQVDETPPVRLTRAGLELDGRSLSLHVGSVHYYAMDPSRWSSALGALKAMGLQGVDTYVPWARHEIEEGSYDFGERRPELDLCRFLRMAQEHDLFVVLRPGPHVNGELTRFGLPEHVVWNQAVMARSRRDNPVVLPAPPLAFPVPSCASRVFRQLVKTWYETLAEVVRPFMAPSGPIVVVQVDNEAAMYFRDGLLDQDFHADVIQDFRRYLREHYASNEALSTAYANPGETLRAIEPPRQLDTSRVAELRRGLDFARFQEHLVAETLGEFAAYLKTAFGPCLLSHNLPPGFELSALNPAVIGQHVDLLGVDLYHRSGPRQRELVFERVTRLNGQARRSECPSYAAELAAGAPPYFTPFDAATCKFGALCAAAYGVNAFNVYMAVDRDRWIGAAADARGELRELGEFYRSFSAILTRLQLASLSRGIAVRLVVPRLLYQLARVLSVWGPVSATAVAASGGDGAAVVDEVPEGLPRELLGVFLQYRALRRSLERLGVPFEVTDDHALEQTVRATPWTLVLSGGAIPRATLEACQRLAAEGHHITLSPYLPTLDERLEPLEVLQGAVSLLEASSPFELEGVLRSQVQACQLRQVEHRGPVFPSLYYDSEQRPRVMFVINPAGRDTECVLTLPGVSRAIDAFSGVKHGLKAGELSLTVPRKSVALLELAHDP